MIGLICGTHEYPNGWWVWKSKGWVPSLGQGSSGEPGFRAPAGASVLCAPHALSSSVCAPQAPFSPLAGLAVLGTMQVSLPRAF